LEEGRLVNRDRRKEGRRKKGEGRRTNRRYVNYNYLSRVSSKIDFFIAERRLPDSLHCTPKGQKSPWVCALKETQHYLFYHLSGEGWQIEEGRCPNR
jgi:hypothetical protein